MAEPLLGNTEGALKPANVSTKQQRIAELARKNPKMAFTSLNHFLDEEWLRYAYELTRKDGAVGIDGQTAADYEANLEQNLRDLLGRIKSGRYLAPPVRRAYIPKADGSKRPLGIPTFEDKVAQRAIVLLLEPIYEQDFLPLLLKLCLAPSSAALGATGFRDATRGRMHCIAASVAEWAPRQPHNECAGDGEADSGEGIGEMTQGARGGSRCPALAFRPRGENAAYARRRRRRSSTGLQRRDGAIRGTICPRNGQDRVPP